jgi:hypothetical protein
MYLWLGDQKTVDWFMEEDFYEQMGIHHAHATLSSSPPIHSSHHLLIDLYIRMVK